MNPPASSPAETLVESAWTALSQGEQLFNWWVSREDSGKLSKFGLKPPHEGCEVRAFFDALEIDGSPVSVMGCEQIASFRLTSHPSGSAPSLNRYLKSRFVRLCQWTNPDGLPGGFSYLPLVGLRSGSSQSETMTNEIDFDLNTIGEQFEWVVFRVDINDFVRTFPGLHRHAKFFSRFVREAAYVVFHRLYSSVPSVFQRDTLGECAFGYSFLPCLVEPNYFGFGPGRFGTAIKQFHYTMQKDGTLRIRTSFVVAPRSQRVLYIGGFDPVYGAVHLLNALTFNLLKIKTRVHDKLDAFMLGHHARVHQALLDGMRGVWEETDWASVLAAGKADRD